MALRWTIPLAAAILIVWIASGGERPELAYIGFDRERGMCDAVIVDALPLAHTQQLLPLNADGRLSGKDAAAQIKRVFERLADTLAANRSGLDRLVKLNFVVACTEVVAAIERFLARQFASGRGPATSFVVSSLPHAGAVVAVDAVAVADSEAGKRGQADCRILPPGARVYIAGQAEPGKSLGEATRKTLESLRATLKFLGLSAKDVIQVKSFLTPMSAVAEVNDEMAKFFGRDDVPPQVFVEWRSSLPIEIELIVQAGKDRPGPVVEFLTPPGMKSSPVFSRVTRINRGKSIYISGLHGRKAAGPHDEIIDIFDRLGGILKKTGSDFKHLAKATYYVTTAETTRKMGELRPRYYDPRRPPSASLAPVAGVGLAGRSVTLDMIAVPVE